ncbi:MAG TPA: BON domain-containing protein [Planctomycetaceae bacterium]|nr:BON domain-containing protein [Planctomycetaceae bacterium]
MSRSILTALALTVCALRPLWCNCVAVAAESNEPSFSAPSPSADEGKNSSQRPALSDREIRLAVENELLASAAIKSHRLQVLVEDGIVTLAGRVRNLLDEDIAVGLTQRVRGVVSVVDQLEVNGPYRPDAELQQAVEAALDSDPATHILPVHVVVKDGIATLDGEVAGYGAKTLASDIARSVVGLADVDDRMKVNLKFMPSDAELNKEIAELLKYSVQLDQVELDVVVKAGTAVLNGAVTTDFQRSVAEQLALQAGAKDVDLRGIVVEWDLANQELRASRYQKATDEEIRDAVTRALKYDPRVLSFHPEVEVKNGVVTLTGNVSNLAARRAAERAARFTVGVRQVNDHLNINWSETTPTDEEISEYTIAAIHRDPYLHDEEIIVDCENAHIELHGIVETNFEKNHAEWTASRQRDVVHVDNYLVVRAKWIPKTDEAITADLKDRMELMFVNDQENVVTFKVSNGVAIMEGSVETWYLWQNVLDEAVAAGAREPHMMIEVRSGTPASLRYSGPHDYVPQ